MIENASANNLQQGLEWCLVLLDRAIDDPLRVDGNACITCFQLEEDCQCQEADKVHWPVIYARLALATTLEDMDVG